MSRIAYHLQWDHKDRMKQGWLDQVGAWSPPAPPFTSYSNQGEWFEVVDSQFSPGEKKASICEVVGNPENWRVNTLKTWSCWPNANGYLPDLMKWVSFHSGLDEYLIVLMLSCICWREQETLKHSFTTHSTSSCLSLAFSCDVRWSPEPHIGSACALPAVCLFSEKGDQSLPYVAVPGLKPWTSYSVECTLLWVTSLGLLTFSWPCA